MAHIKTKTKALAEARIRKGWSGADLARQVGVTKHMIYLVEGSKANPSPALARRIVDKLEVEFDDLFEIADNPK